MTPLSPPKWGEGRPFILRKKVKPGFHILAAGWLESLPIQGVWGVRNMESQETNPIPGVGG
jgi:hypothetical protein